MLFRSSRAVLKACAKRNVACLVVRGVFDELSDDLENLGVPFDQQGNLVPGKVVVNLLKSPKLILQLPHLQKKAMLVNRQLAKVVEWFVIN